MSAARGGGGDAHDAGAALCVVGACPLGCERRLSRRPAALPRPVASFSKVVGSDTWATAEAEPRAAAPSTGEEAAALGEARLRLVLRSALGERQGAPPPPRRLRRRAAARGATSARAGSVCASAAWRTRTGSACGSKRAVRATAPRCSSGSSPLCASERWPVPSCLPAAVEASSLAAEEAGCAAWKMLAESALDTFWPLLRPGKAAAHLEGGALYAVAVRSVREPADNLPKAPPRARAEAHRQAGARADGGSAAARAVPRRGGIPAGSGQPSLARTKAELGGSPPPPPAEADEAVMAALVARWSAAVVRGAVAVAGALLDEAELRGASSCCSWTTSWARCSAGWPRRSGRRQPTPRRSLCRCWPPQQKSRLDKGAGQTFTQPSGGSTDGQCSHHAVVAQRASNRIAVAQSGIRSATRATPCEHARGMRPREVFVVGDEACCGTCHGQDLRLWGTEGWFL